MASVEHQRRSAAPLAALALLALSFGLAMLVARWFTLPNLIGFSGQDPFAERDFWCLLGSVACALTASAVSFRHALAGTRPAGGSVLGAAIAGVGFAFLLLLFWWRHVLYYALLLAPSHALALMGVALSWRRHGRDAALAR
jgi:hypothetical protein